AVAILLRNEPAFLEALLGAHLLGACAVPINWHLTAEEIGYVLRDSGATHLVLHADLLPAVRDHVPEGVLPVCVTVPPEVREACGITAEQAAAPAGAPEWEDWLAAHPPLAGRPAHAGGTMSYTSGTTGRSEERRVGQAGRDRKARAR